MMYGRCPPPALIEATERPMAQTHYLTSAIRLPITGATPRPSTKLVRAAHVVPTDPETILSHAGSAG
jgi:hypothetical protein